MKYKFNKEQLKFIEDKRGFGGWVKILLKYFGLSILLALLYYISAVEICGISPSTKALPHRCRFPSVKQHSLFNMEEKS